jgi:hypothetical protein
MKTWIIAASLLFSSAVGAQGGDFIRYRANDPFVFCTQGMKIPVPCWVPIPPYNGEFMYTGLCEPNPYGRPWDAQDYDALQQLVSICPKAVTSGGWKGVGGGATSPFIH